MPFAELHEHRLYYEDTGGTGPAVLFSHGFLLDHAMWAPQIAALRDQYRCITWDERSHGMSDVRGPFTHWDSARDALGILDVCGVAEAVLVGFSQGGFLTLRAALTAPERVRAMVLIDTAAGVDTPDVVAGYRAMQKRWVEEGPVGEVATINSDLIFGPEYDASAWHAKWQAKPPRSHNLAWDTVIERDDILGRLGEIRCPTLLLNGTKDMAFTLETAREISSKLGNSKGVIAVEGAYHAPSVTHPGVVTPAIERFLAQHA